MKESKIKMVAIWTYATSGVLSDIPLGSVLIKDCDTKTEEQIYSEARDLIAKSMGFKDWSEYKKVTPKNSDGKIVLIYNVFDANDESFWIADKFNRSSSFRAEQDRAILEKLTEEAAVLD